MRTVLPALAQAVVFNSTPYEGLVGNLKDCLQVYILFLWRLTGCQQ